MAYNGTRIIKYLGINLTKDKQNQHTKTAKHC